MLYSFPPEWPYYNYSATRVKKKRVIILYFVYVSTRNRFVDPKHVYSKLIHFNVKQWTLTKFCSSRPCLVDWCTTAGFRIVGCFNAGRPSTPDNGRDAHVNQLMFFDSFHSVIYDPNANCTADKPSLTRWISRTILVRSICILSVTRRYQLDEFHLWAVRPGIGRGR